MNDRYRYPWPASALGPAEMSLLHEARQCSPGRVAITQLVAQAVRAAYGGRTAELNEPSNPNTPETKRNLP